MLAVVRRQVVQGTVPSAWQEPLDKVWQYIRSQPGLWTTGHNVFLYHRPSGPDALLECEFGVEVTRPFETAGEVCFTQTPAGEAAVAIHRGPYTGLRQTHAAIQSFLASGDRQFAGISWEIYGDPTPNPADTETAIVYLLR